MPGLSPIPQMPGIHAEVFLLDEHAIANRVYQDTVSSVVRIDKCVVWNDVSTKEVCKGLEGFGTGIIWDSQGNIVTNYHVIKCATQISVDLADKSTYDADVVGYDESKDIVVLHINVPKEKLRPIPIGKSPSEPGPKVYAIGHPFGENNAYTEGMISGLNRPIYVNERLVEDKGILHTAPTNPGNSGGPLLDIEGNLIGVNTATISYNGCLSGLAYAIPIESVRHTVDRLMSGEDTLSNVIVPHAPSPNEPAGNTDLLDNSIKSDKRQKILEQG